MSKLPDVRLTDHAEYKAAADNLDALRTRQREIDAEIVRLTEQAQRVAPEPAGAKLVVGRRGAAPVDDPRPRLATLEREQREVESAINLQKQVIDQLRPAASRLACAKVGGEYRRLVATLAKTARAFGAAVDAESEFLENLEGKCGVDVVAPVTPPGVDLATFSLKNAQSRLALLLVRIAETNPASDDAAAEPKK